MISIKRYLDTPWESPAEDREPRGLDLFVTAMKAYASALREIGNCSVIACPGTGDGLQRKLAGVRTELSTVVTEEALTEAEKRVREELQNWGRGTAEHYEQKASEVKDMLLIMAKTAQSVSTRDERSADQLTEVTERLRALASLDDLKQIRTSVEKCATDLRSSVDRMREEGQSAVNQLRRQVAEYRSKLEAAEDLAWRDELTGLSSRRYVEGQLDARIAEGLPFCVALLDLDGFKGVNDRHGHHAGDEVLKQFSAELRAARRATDVIGRWGGDEFLLLLDCNLAEAKVQIERLRERICGVYTIQDNSGTIKLRVEASVGLAERKANEEMKELVARADAAMYQHKATRARASETGQRATKQAVLPIGGWCARQVASDSMRP